MPRRDHEPVPLRGVRRAVGVDDPGGGRVSAEPEGRALVDDAADEADLRVRRDVAAAIPDADDDTPLARELAATARLRITLRGRQLPRPPHTRVICVANQKGGVGKTTTAVNLAAALAQSGLTVLVIDVDPQGNASTALGIDHHSEVLGTYDVLTDACPLAETLQECPDVPGLWCCPATIDLAGAEIELVTMADRESQLAHAVAGLQRERAERGLPRFDYVVIDCPPSLGLITINALMAAGEVLIPIQCEYYALEGVTQLLRSIELVRERYNPRLHVSTMVLTMYDGRTRLAAQVADEVRLHFPAQVLRQTIPRSVRVSEAPSHGQTVMTYDASSSGAMAYLASAREIAEQTVARAG